MSRGGPRSNAGETGAIACGGTREEIGESSRGGGREASVRAFGNAGRMCENPEGSRRLVLACIPARGSGGARGAAMRGKAFARGVGQRHMRRHVGMARAFAGAAFAGASEAAEGGRRIRCGARGDRGEAGSGRVRQRVIDASTECLGLQSFCRDRAPLSGGDPERARRRRQEIWVMSAESGCWGQQAQRSRVACSFSGSFPGARGAGAGGDSG